MTIIALLLASSTVYGGPKGTAARAEYEKGTAAYNLGHFDEAAQHYEAAYNLAHDPNMLFNIAQSYRMAGELEKALPVFRGFLRESSVDAPNRPLAERLTEEVKRKIEESKAAAATPSPPPTPPPAPPPVAPTPVVQVSDTEPTPTPQPVGRGLRIAGVTVGIVGVAALGSGLAFNLLANSMAKDLNKNGGYDRDKASTQSTYQTLTWVGYGVGGACVATGALLYFLGRRGSESSAVALVPSFAPGQAGVNLQGAF